MFDSHWKRARSISIPVVGRVFVNLPGARAIATSFLTVLAFCISPLLASGRTGWPDAGHDETAQRHSPLKQINVHNVSELAPAWVFAMKTAGDFPVSWAIESLPLVIDGRMYLSWPYCHVAALDPAIGRQLGRYTAPHCTYRGPGLSSMRSLAYWPGDKVRPARILFGTEDGELYALDAKTGRPAAEFGDKGVVDLKTPEVMNGFPHMHYGLTSAPLVYENLAITGSHIDDETGSKGPAGDVRAWDVRTGKLVWTFHTVPRPGETGHETWTGDTWKKVGGANVWSFFTLDVKRGILYMPVGSVNNDHYGADRPGPNLFANSLVAVDAKTGKLKWYFQAIHHDLWDYDMPAPPMLFDVVHDGKKIPAVAAITKNPLLFILNRVTGKPIYGVEERPVPAGDVPGEWYSPTQPFPLKPPPLSRQSFTENDFAKITPEQEAAYRQWYSKFLERGGTPNKGPYTPSSLHGALQFPDHWGELGCGAEPSIQRWDITSSIRRTRARFTSFIGILAPCRPRFMPTQTANRRCSTALARIRPRLKPLLPSFLFRPMAGLAGLPLGEGSRRWTLTRARLPGRSHTAR